MKRFIPILLAAAGALHAQNTAPRGRMAGTVVDEHNVPISSAQVTASLAGWTTTWSATTNSRGEFALPPLPVGEHELETRRLGYQRIVTKGVKVELDQTTRVTITLPSFVTKLTAVTAVISPVEIKHGSTEVANRVDLGAIGLLPTGRDASSAIALLPGARRDQIWGGAGQLTNNFQLDGISMNHPGVGGEFLQPSIDWIESIEVKGLGSGAEFGDFQGGIVNVITKSGTSTRRGAIRLNYETPKLTASNFNLHEDGQEQAGRRELTGEVRGPISRSLAYFVAGQAIAREMRYPNVRSRADVAFAPFETSERDLRGMGKLTWTPPNIGRFDALIAHARLDKDRANITGFDASNAGQTVSAPSTVWEATWNQATSAKQRFDVKIGGFFGRETRLGEAGSLVPSVQTYATGYDARAQNAGFDVRLEPRSVNMKAAWTFTRTPTWAVHEMKIGAEHSAGTWDEVQTRNGGMTWRPYVNFSTGVIDLADPTTWARRAAEFGGEVHLHAGTQSSAIFAEDAISISDRITITAGLRAGRWAGDLAPEGGSMFRAVSATALDPRIGFTIDPLGTNAMVIKAHVGRYHQGMASSLFDRVAGANAYEDVRFYTDGPAITTPTATPGEAAFAATYRPFIQTYSQSGPVAAYRQPYVDQLVAGVEKTIVGHWKIASGYTARENKDFVGLVDRNMAVNYTALRDLKVYEPFSPIALRDWRDSTLVIPLLYVSNRDLRRTIVAMRALCEPRCPTQPFPGMSWNKIDSLPWNPDVVFTNIPEAERHFRQFYVSLQAQYARFSALASLTWSGLEGNVNGVTTSGAVASGFDAGPWARPNEQLRSDGKLPGLNPAEIKFYLTGRLPARFSGGLSFAHYMGENITPYFVIEAGRYNFVSSANVSTSYGDSFRDVSGETLFLRPRGSDHYGDRQILDVHVERPVRFRGTEIVTSLDVFNALANEEVTLVRTQVQPYSLLNETLHYGARQLRVPPRSIRLGSRLTW